MTIQNPLSFLFSLERAKLFSAVGLKNADDYRYASSWMDAMSFCVGTKWSNALIESLNDLSGNVLKVSPERYREWNSLITGMRPRLLEFAESVTDSLRREQKLPDKFTFSVLACLQGVGMEHGYSDIVKPGFYTNTILVCLQRGHFPCGWDGKFPDGRLIVY